MAARKKKRSIGFQYAWRGLKWVVANERNMRIHLGFVALVLVLCCFLPVDKLEAAILSLVIFLVLVSEMFNSALEQVVDLCVGTEFHRLAQKSKDVAAGAVLLAAINSVIVGLIIFGPKLLAFLGS